MKRKLILVAAIFLAGTLFVNAQGGFPRRTVEERVKMVMDKMSPLNLDKDKLTQTDSVFTQYYKDMDAKRQEMMNSGSMDRDKMRETMMKMSADRDDKLKKIFTEDQFKKWKDEIEPSLRPQRGGGGGWRNN
ncbi:MAG TPA: hypothetical protein VFS36_13800 [Chitinophagaceae bacterium]|jgi:hypothetical protein|nr:hypothetical protein [Chitinophagaceae bacterium]